MPRIEFTNPQVASSETARDINRSIVLNLIRTDQPISRADLARATGLQRSTVSLIVDQLMGERWVVEGAVGNLPRGRKPRLLRLNNDRAGIIGINIMPRGTTIVLADLNFSFRDEVSIPTAPEPRDFIKSLCTQVRNLIRAHPDIAFEGIGVSIPGRVDYASQKLVFAPNLGWKQVDLKTPLERTTRLAVQIENAANACALAEVWAGPYKGTRELIAVTVSEGIGTGIIANGHLVRGGTGAAGEFGHVSFNGDGPACGCGSRGCWEAYASNSAAIKYYNCRISKSGAQGNRAPAPAAVSSFSDLILLAEGGDVIAGEVFDRMANYLGIGIAMLINALAPSIIIIVGEVTRVWGRINPIVQRVVQERARTHASTRIVPLDNSTRPRLRGTVALVLQKHFQPQLSV